MKAFGLTLRIAGATLVLVALQVVWTHPRSLAQGALSVLPNLLVVLALALVAASTRHQGWKLAGTLFVLYFGINQLNTLDEALLFNVGVNASQAIRMMGSGFLASLIFAPLLVLILGCWEKKPQEEAKPLVPHSAASRVGRILLADLLYVLCYFVAGMIVFPFVKDFYAGINLPAPASILEMQVFRGLVYVAAGLAVADGMKGDRGRTAVALGLSFPILAGVAPLLLPNPYLPDHVRLAHGLEIGISNLVYGVLLGYLITRKAAPATGGGRIESAESLS
ncbi:MAG TPA: hypothetical protein VNM47_08755 [Terriglobia bacterium]|nr:hypothetical protein [Terriglobia bacterium]